MSEKKKLLLNCDVCDTRKIKEDNYSHYESIFINADVLIVNEQSKAVLNRLPVTMNNDRTIEVEGNTEVYVKSVNGSYEITGNSAVEEHTILVVNGLLLVHKGTEEILKKYEGISVNGSVRYPKSLEGYMGKMNVNGSVETYPDDCVLLDSEFTIDKYFPLRAKEGSRYYVKNLVIIKDTNVDVYKLAQKGIFFETEKLLVPECKIEDCIPMFDESVEFIVVPDGMKLICDSVTLNEEFVNNEGGSLFIYGDINVDDSADISSIFEKIKKLTVKGTVRLKAKQEQELRSIKAENEEVEILFDNIEIIKDTLRMSDMPSAKIDRRIFDNVTDGIEVRNVAILTIAEDVTVEMIIEKLKIENCATIICSKEQESAVSSVSNNVASIGEGMDGAGGILGGIGGILGGVKDFMEAKKINADSYVM